MFLQGVHLVCPSVCLSIPPEHCGCIFQLGTGFQGLPRTTLDVPGPSCRALQVEPSGPACHLAVRCCVVALHTRRE